MDVVEPDCESNDASACCSHFLVLQMQMLLTGLSQEVPELIQLLISRAYLPDPASSDSNPSASKSRALSSNGITYEARDRGEGLIASLQMLSIDSDGPALARKVGKEHHLDSLCFEALEDVSLLASVGYLLRIWLLC